jgi:hypothetical protein
MTREERPHGVHMGHPMGDEMTMCGFAIDAFDEDGMGHMRTARAGESISCNDCLRVIRAVREVKNGRMPL